MKRNYLYFVSIFLKSFEKVTIIDCFRIPLALLRKISDDVTQILSLMYGSMQRYGPQLYIYQCVVALYLTLLLYGFKVSNNYLCPKFI